MLELRVGTRDLMFHQSGSKRHSQSAWQAVARLTLQEVSLLDMATVGTLGTSCRGDKVRVLRYQSVHHFDWFACLSLTRADENLPLCPVFRSIVQDKLFITASNLGAESDMFKCAKCKTSRTTFYQKQTRSADEPMTVFITCRNCGHEWRDGG